MQYITYINKCILIKKNSRLDDSRRSTKESQNINPGHPLPSSAYQPIASSSIVSGTVASTKSRCSTHMDNSFKPTNRPSSPVIGITVPPKKQHLQQERQAAAAAVAANLNTGPPQPSLSAQSLSHSNVTPSYPGL